MPGSTAPPVTSPTVPSAAAPSTAVTVEELRVAQQELTSGSTRGEVFLQLSPGAVAFLTDRPVVQARVARQLRERVERDQV